MFRETYLTNACRQQALFSFGHIRAAAQHRFEQGNLIGRGAAGTVEDLGVERQDRFAGLGQPAAGTIKCAHNLRVGYFSQEKNDLPDHGTVIEALRMLDVTVDEGTLRDHLALFLFCGDDVEKPVSELSGGEKQRLSLARMTRAAIEQ